MLALTTTIDENGDLNLPPDVQAAAGIHGGSKLVILIEDGRVVLQPLLAHSLDELRGLFASDRDVVAELQQERRQDKW